MAVVLVVDDEYGITNLLEDVLSDEGHRVITATNGEQALERMSAERPDAVLTDYMMPVMDGVALINAMSVDPELKGIPIVIMSSVPEATIRDRCANFSAYVSKPFRIYELIDIVTGLLNRQAG
jgi:CheY-like chemotaxis protein